MSDENTMPEEQGRPAAPLPLLAELRGIHNRLLALVEGLDAEVLWRRYHPELPTIARLLVCCAGVERRWLFGEILEDPSAGPDVTGGGDPAGHVVPEREDPERLLERVGAEFESHLLLLSGLGPCPLPAHPLLEDARLVHFFVEHHQLQHERMLLVLAQRAQSRHRGRFFPDRRLEPSEGQTDFVELPGCAYPVGGEPPAARSLELPAWVPELEAFAVARLPVSNAQWLAFMEAGGYERRDWWSEAGWAWKQRHGLRSPAHWRQDARGWWYGILAEGPYELHPDFPVHGISWFEAEAFARHAGARLPRECEWEAAHRLHVLQLADVVHEWCRDHPYPYPGHEHYPPDELPGQGERSLRGGCLYSRPRLKRASFRYWAPPEARYLLSGVRLARTGSQGLPT